MSTPRYPLIEFTIEVGTWEFGGEAYPDTGFEGALIIPSGVGREILAEPVLTPWRLADGSVRTAKSWNGLLDIEGHTFRAEVVAIGPRVLIGREILDRFEICFQFGKIVRLRFADETM